MVNDMGGATSQETKGYDFDLRRLDMMYGPFQIENGTDIAIYAKVMPG